MVKIFRMLYDNEYASIIDIYFYEFFIPFKSRALALQNIWDTLSDILEKCLCFSVIKIEPVSINPSQAVLSLFFFSVIYTFLLK
jgi:hypothetical protein